LIDPHAKALPHNADLIAPERKLVESLFRKSEGTNVIVATPTLAQGMNLPVELAIIAGDKRQAQDSPRSLLEAHELLNAAGRAGRAGHLANGMVILIPEPVVSFGQDNKASRAAFDKLLSILPKEDQCLDIQDPLEGILDRIQSGAHETPQVGYFLNYLRTSTDLEQNNTQAERFLKRTFSYFQAETGGKQAEYQERIDKTIELLSSESDANIAVLETAARTGIPISVLSKVYSKLIAEKDTLPASIVEWSNWIIDFLVADVDAIRDVFRNNALTDLETVVLGKKGALLGHSLENFKTAVQMWLTGKPFCEIEMALGTTQANLRHCPRARDLALKVMSRSYSMFCGSVAHLARAMSEELALSEWQLLTLETLPLAVRRGIDNPYKVAYSAINRRLTRTRIHKQFNAESIGAFFVSFQGNYAALHSRMKSLIDLRNFI
jgi:ATP-dependent RNA helicase HelY